MITNNMITNLKSYFYSFIWEDSSTKKNVLKSEYIIKPYKENINPNKSIKFKAKNLNQKNNLEPAKKILAPKTRVKLENTNEQDERGIQQIHEAAASGNLNAVQKLLEAGADINSKDNSGESVIWCAIVGGNLKLVDFLVNRGADLTALNSHGYDALDMALAMENSEMVKCILGDKEMKIGSLGIYQSVMDWLRDRKGNKSLNPRNLLRILGHYFGMEGHYIIENLKHFNGSLKIHLEGFRAGEACNIVMEDIVRYLPHSGLTEEVKKCVKVMVQHQSRSRFHGRQEGDVSDDKLCELINKNIPISISCGWEGHAVNITMNTKYLIYSNKKAEVGNHRGMKVFEILGEITPEIIGKIHELDTPFDFPNDKVTSTLESLLELKSIGFFKVKYQKALNCTFVNQFLSFKAALILLGTDLKEAHNEHKACKLQAKQYWLESLYTLLDKQEPDENLKMELYFGLLHLVDKLKIKSTCMGETLPQDQFILDSILKYISQLETHDYLIAIKNTIERGNFKTDLVSDKHWGVLLDSKFRTRSHYST